MAVFNLTFAAAVLVLAALATLEKPALALGLVLAAGQSALSGIGALLRTSGVSAYVGGISLTLSFLALVGAGLLLYRELTGRMVPSRSRRGAAAAAFREGLAAQLDGVDDEPGVRRRL